MARFSVDTHLFRELGEFLVGRDSTALAELIKNAYDADASTVVLEGRSLQKRDRGRIVISDDGAGMTEQQFRDGFLRIAARTKEGGNRRSPKFARRYTGEKGVGRLAAHKLASKLTVHSAADTGPPITGVIDWDLVESATTLDDVSDDAIQVVVGTQTQTTSVSQTGTRIELARLRRAWTDRELARLFDEISSFSPPVVLTRAPKKLLRTASLLGEISVRDCSERDPGFRVELQGDFEAGEQYWQTVGASASWILEIDALTDKMKFRVSPTTTWLRENSEATTMDTVIDHPAAPQGPRFVARILVRDGKQRARGHKRLRAWSNSASGVRLYMEGFRVLPYGERSDDWLELDAAYAKRTRALPFIEEFGLEESASGEGLKWLSNSAYFGAVFLHQERSGGLHMLVNREGFVPNESLLNLRSIVGLGISLLTRHRAAQDVEPESESKVRTPRRSTEERETSSVRVTVEQATQRATNLAASARAEANKGDLATAQRLISRAAAEFEAGADARERLLTEHTLIRMLAAVGLQMSAFVHELRGLLGMARALEASLDRLRASVSASDRRRIAKLLRQAGELRRVAERQAAYLADVASPDARRRRSRQNLSQHFDKAKQLYEPVAAAKSIEIANDIPTELKTPPMFPSEVSLILSNLLANAVKAAGPDGRVVGGGHLEDEHLVILVANSGARVALASAERWFRPFESTTDDAIDPLLGQGMGMGLPITRNMVEEYGGTVRFVRPRRPFATTVEVRLPLSD